jgi:hypothetical protein
MALSILRVHKEIKAIRDSKAIKDSRGAKGFKVIPALFLVRKEIKDFKE